MAKFDNAKIGDRVFSTRYGWGKVISIDNEDVNFPLVVEFDRGIRMWYKIDGTTHKLDKFPDLYWNEVKLPTEEEDKKPFDLVGYLREKLQPTEFRVGEENFYLYFDAEDEMRYSFSSEIDIAITVYFKTCTRELVDELDENKITPQQLKQAYKELGWL